jgi:gamma-glutamyl hercynylcysteine S-oxide hydrolase
MCRIAAYFGPPIALSALLDDPPHGLTDQSRNAREMADGSVAGDGWGLGWFAPGGGPTPGMLKSILPLWADLNARTAPRAIVSGCAVGHARFASPGIEVCLTNTPLFVLDDHLFTVNGELSPWPGPLSRAIRDRLDPDHEADVRGSTDAELLGALWRTHFRRTGGTDAAEAIRGSLREARDLALEHGGQIKVNLILALADGLLAVRFAEPDDPNSLYYLAGRGRRPDGTLVASEPFDDRPGWGEVEPSSLVRVGAGGVALEPLGIEPKARRPRQSA